MSSYALQHGTRTSPWTWSLTGVKQAGPVQVVADMLNEKGEVEKSFTADAAVVAEADADPGSLVAVGRPAPVGRVASPTFIPFG